ERGLGLLLVLYAALGLLAWKPRLPEGAGAPVGLMTGAVTAATGVFVLPAVPWLQARGFGREEFVRALGISFTASTLALAALLAASRELPSSAVLASALAIIPALVGQRLGEALRHRLSEAAFRRCFQLGLAALGLWLVWRG
ncbi:MAG TPA: TSUP family transporter, partial [Roseococcus sp.]|nr:TSUP family transporter [Roseococcus sp.]